MTRRVYIAGPMSRESFCRCDRPSARSTLPIAADLIGAGVWDYNYPASIRTTTRPDQQRPRTARKDLA